MIFGKFIYHLIAWFIFLIIIGMIALLAGMPFTSN